MVSIAKKKPFSLSSGTGFFSSKQDIAPKQNCNVLKKAKQLNKAGKIMFVLLSVLFNLVFWYIAIKEYNRPAEEYID